MLQNTFISPPKIFHALIQSQNVKYILLACVARGRTIISDGYFLVIIAKDKITLRSKVIKDKMIKYTFFNTKSGVYLHPYS